MKAAIVASAVISPQPTHNAGGFPEQLTAVMSNRFYCNEPDYRELINPLQLRRMPRILKMGLATAQTCINRSGHTQPDAIMVGTGLGCLDNLEKFLLEVIDHHEHVTSVLPFINSTHNAVAAQIAMLLKNHNYNITYCHRGFSFESALQDALLQIEEGQAQSILVGGIDECTEDFMKIHGYLGYWKKIQDRMQLLHSKTSGTIAGEGAAFFMLSAAIGGSDPRITLDGVHTFFIPGDAAPGEIRMEISGFLQQCGVTLQEIDCVMLGLNGDGLQDTGYYELQHDFFGEHTDFLYYKHLCGEYYTASAFALWLATLIFRDGKAPDAVRLTWKSRGPFKKILIYNHIRNREHSLILLSHGRL
jgi:3-oxoacyl-(acyl-carrier-protein) synthase